MFGVAFSPDGLVASAGLDAQGEGKPANDSAVRVWDAAARELVALTVPGGSRCVAFSPDGRIARRGRRRQEDPSLGRRRAGRNAF